jgi:catabolite repression protein CreC
MNPVQQIRWVPRSENSFAVLFSDGSIVFMDKEREDTQFPPPNPLPPHVDRDNPHANGFGHHSKILPPTLKIHKSLSTSAFLLNAAKRERELAMKYNPLSYWELTNSMVSAFDFSQDGKLLAVTTMQGHLALFNWEKETLTDVFTSYYGGLECLAFSPDSRYLLCGGQDDMVSIFSVPERRLVGRGVGHHSWVTGLAFDPFISTDRACRFGSVGDDGRLLLWELSAGTLVMPKQVGSPRPTGSGHDRTLSISSMNPAASSTSLVRSMSTIQGTTVYHPIVPRRECPTLAPIVGSKIDDDPLCQIHFREREIVTTCKEGSLCCQIRLIDRTY